MLPGLIVSLVLCAAVLAVAGWLYAQRQHLRSERDRLQRELAEVQDRAARLDQENRTLLTEKERLVTTAEQMRQQFEAAQQRARETFDATAAKALQQATEQFLQLAKKTFEGEQKDASAQLEQRKQAIDALLKPIRESLDKHGKALNDLEVKREGAYQSLRQLVTSLQQDQLRLQSETANLVKALRRPDVRGRWGEMQLRRVAELAGMIDRCDFSEQQSGVDSEGRARRPDMIVHLPAGRTIVVDAKAPLDAYLSAIEAAGDDEREQAFGRYVRHVEDKVQDLAGKQYQSQFDRSPDFVVLFIPGESFLQAALQRKPDLLDSAFNRGVVLATPSTLIALLKAVATGWREQQIADNARRISDLGVELHRRLAVLCAHLENLGKAVGKTVEHYNKLVGSYESQVLVQARRFKELGADSPRELPAEDQITPIDAAPRELKTPQ